MAKKQIDLGLTGLDELFMDDRERAESKLPKIHEIPLSEIDEFPNHPFHVRIDEDMDQLVESIKERGIITPVTLRQKPDGRYEIVSGHRRTKACELAGLATVKAEIKELSRDEAIILMYTAIAPIPLSTFAGEPTQSIGKSFLKSYASVCLEGAVIVLACVIFSAFASSPPVVDAGAAAASMVWSYIGELIFNMLILVGSVKMADRVVREMMGL